LFEATSQSPFGLSRTTLNFSLSFLSFAESLTASSFGLSEAASAFSLSASGFLPVSCLASLSSIDAAKMLPSFD